LLFLSFLLLLLHFFLLKQKQNLLLEGRSWCFLHRSVACQSWFPQKSSDLSLMNHPKVLIWNLSIIIRSQGQTDPYVLWNPWSWRSKIAFNSQMPLQTRNVWKKNKYPTKKKHHKNMQYTANFIETMDNHVHLLPLGNILNELNTKFNLRPQVPVQVPVQNHQIGTFFPSRPLDYNCAICLEEMDHRKRVKVLPCMHAFHEKCINVWLERNRICPICRHHIWMEKSKSFFLFETYRKKL